MDIATEIMDAKKDKATEIVRKIYELKKCFMISYSTEPNQVNLGHEEYYWIRASTEFLGENLYREHKKPYTIFSMKINHIDEYNCLEVGLMIK